MSNDKKPEAPKQTESQAHDAALVKATAEAVAESFLPLFAALRNSNGAPADSAAAAAQRAADKQEMQYRASQACQVCGQRLAGCHGEHTKMVVYPQRYPQYGEYFRGVCINGVWYLSNNETHEILVPSNAAGDIAHKVQKAEEEELIGRTGRVKQHNSGDVQRPKGFNPAVDSWR